MNITTTFPRIRVSGTPSERGRQYGAQARERVHHARNGYERSFAASGIAWPQAIALAERHLAASKAAFPELVDEIRSIAEGAGLPFADVFAMNCRTEILWSAVVARAGAVAPTPGGECSSFALMPSRTASGNTYVGQNWDWLLHGLDSVVVLEVERDDAPNFVTIVEAGLLAKTMVNAEGVGVAVNTLVSSLDGGAGGVPFHLMIRALADAHHVYDVLETLSAHGRASSGNYLVGAPGGAVLNIETAPGDARTVSPLIPDRGALAHTNHFLGPVTGGHDLAPVAMADSYVRLGRMRDLVVEAAAPATIRSLDAALRDHTDAPGSICCHPDERHPEASQWITAMSVVMDLESRVLHLTEGSPCQVQRHAVDYSAFLAARSAWLTRLPDRAGRRRDLRRRSHPVPFVPGLRLGRLAGGGDEERGADHPADHHVGDAVRRGAVHPGVAVAVNQPVRGVLHGGPGLGRRGCRVPGLPDEGAPPELELES